MTLIYLFCFVGALVLSFILTRTIRQMAVRNGWVIAPTSSRHIHSAPIPRLGGVAIYLSFVIATLALVGASQYFGLDIGLPLRTIFFIILAGTIIFALGLWDDIRSVPPLIKVVVEAIAAVILFFQGFGIFTVPFFSQGEPLLWIALPATVLWVLLITNAFNLLDGLDGLAAGSAVFSTLAVFVAGLLDGNLQAAVLMVTLAGSILGFLRFNFNPATIFLGDGGSLFIGFMLSALGLVGAQKKSTLVAVAIPVVSFGLPILETGISILRRFLNGQPIFSADRGHIHHKLIERGLSQRQVVVILYAVSAGCGLLSLFLTTPGGGSVGIVLFVLGLGVWLGVQHLGYHEFFELGRVAKRTIEQKQVIINNLAIRRAADELGRADSYEEVFQILEQTFATNDFDGFSLRVGLARGASEMGPCGCRQTLLCYKWSKPGSELITEQEAMWTLKLDLLSKQREPLGEFAVYRAYYEKACLVDVNLLVSGFQESLATTIFRLMEAERESVARAANNGLHHAGITLNGAHNRTQQSVPLQL